MVFRPVSFLLIIGLALAAASCTTAKKKKSPEAVKAEIAESFTKLKEAIADLREGHTEKLWMILAEESLAEAEKRAKSFRAEFAKLDKDEQQEQARQWGATADQIRERLNGQGYLGIVHAEIYKRYWLMVGAPVDDITPKGDEATVYYSPDESDRDKKSVTFVREEGGWKAVLHVP
jgi:hypothetical protein